MGKKGGGSSNAKVRVPGQVDSNAQTSAQIGQYATNLLGPQLSLANWASQIATGGNTLQLEPGLPGYGSGDPGLFTGQSAGPPLFTSGGGSISGGGGFTGFGGSGGTGVTGGSSVMMQGQSTPGSPSGAMMQGQAAPANSVSALPGANASQYDINSWWQQNQGRTVQTAQGPQTVQGQPPEPGTWAYMVNSGGWSMPTGSGTAPGGAGGGGTSTPGTVAGGGGGGGGGGILGPLLSAAYSAIAGEEQATNEMPGLQQQTGQLTAQAEADAANEQAQSGLLYGGSNALMRQGGNAFNQGESMLQQATTGSGLFPSQAAYVDQATKAQQSAIQQQLASEGLTSSTMNAQMKGEAAQQGAATAGQLIQGNISAAQGQEQVGQASQQQAIAEQAAAQNAQALAQASQKIALGGQELSLGEQTALASELGQIATQAGGLQGQMWTEAMQGQGLIGQTLQTVLASYGSSSQQLAQYTQASADNAQLQTNLEIAQQQASSQGSSSLLGGLGSILGGSGGGSGGGLLGGLGSLFGGIGATAGAGAGTAAAGSAAMDAIGLIALAA